MILKNRVGLILLVPASEYRQTFLDFNFRTVDILLNDEGLKVQSFPYSRMSYFFKEEGFSSIEFECMKGELSVHILKDLLVIRSHFLIATLMNQQQVILVGFFRHFINHLEIMNIKFEIHNIYIKEDYIL